ncbi:MAG: heme biosynthesis protein HemY [Congregibacter sp.]|nr:heme biosynthesis protein HemY [Congregibacter sp.]
MGGLFVIALLALVAGVGVLLIATAVLLLYVSLRFLHRLITSPANVLNWAGERRLRQSARLSSRGLINFVEGNWSRARKQLIRGARYSESPLLNHLMAARASYRLQEPEEMRRQLVLAAESDLEAAIAVDLTQAELQLSDRQYEKALRTLEAARKSPRKHPQVLHLLCKAYDGLGDMQAMLALLPALRKHRVGGALELDELEARIHHDLLEQAGVTGDVALLKARWKKYPARLVDDEAVQLHYLSSLLQCDEVTTVEREIEHRLKKQWQPALVNLYGRIPRKSAQNQISTAEVWLREHRDDAQLLLCLGRLSMVEREWAKARDLLERSHKARPSEEACLELGRLLTAVGEHATAAEVFRVGSGLRKNPLPELPQPDDVIADAIPETRRLET